MRNDARSARSTRQQLRPGANKDDRAAEDREAGPGDCRCNSDCFCNFLATFILRSGGEVQIECPCRSEKRNRYVTQGNGLLVRHRQRTRCPLSDTLSRLFTCISGHRSTPNSDTAMVQADYRGLSLAPRSPGLSTNYGDAYQEEPGLRLLHLGLTLGTPDGVELVLAGKSSKFGGRNRHHVPGNPASAEPEAEDRVPAAAGMDQGTVLEVNDNRGCKCHHRNSSVRLSNSHDSRGWKRI